MAESQLYHFLNVWPWARVLGKPLCFFVMVIGKSFEFPVLP